jgi:hypothetical protein
MKQNIELWKWWFLITENRKAKYHVHDAEYLADVLIQILLCGEYGIIVVGTAQRNLVQSYSDVSFPPFKYKDSLTLTTLYTLGPLLAEFSGSSNT